MPRRGTSRLATMRGLSRASGCADTISAMAKPHGGTFVAQLFKYAGPGSWHFATVPEKFAPPVTHAWGRSPVRATVDGHTWDTSVWRDTKSQRTILAVPKRVRGTKGDGDSVRVRLEFTL